MPTENRSSNTEIISVQRERLDALWREIQDSSLRSEDPAHVRFAAALLAQPAEQRQGEPVALPSCNAKLSDSHDWDQGYRGGWRACLDEISKLGPLYTHADPGALQRSWQAGYDTAWYAKSPAEKRTSVNPVDPGEVERLREDVKRANQDKTAAVMMQRMAEQKLAERDALLHEVWPYDLGTPLKRRIKAALSASAEPSATPFPGYPPVPEDRKLTVEIDERAYLPQFAQKVIRKLQRTQECFEDGQGTDIGKEWLDLLCRLGLMSRVQRSPALWEISDEGDALLEARAALERKP